MLSPDDKLERRRKQLADAQQRRRDKLKAEGKRAASGRSGSSGPSGGQATQAQRAKRYRDGKKAMQEGE